ncbi:MAG: DUF1800 domain-containing protein [Planctomycetes bacterium]|nr:DUF1800 domain-containing protein [Planctomycetota bacterium]
MNLAPFVPGVDGPFDAAAAAHLLRHAAFGSRPEERDEAVRVGLQATLERLFARDEGKAAAQLAALAPSVAQGDDLPRLQALWLGRMVESACPLVEKLALFWHNHFATSFTKIQQCDWMWRQYELFRALGGGPFRELLQAAARDPALLVWLDGNSNVKSHPNENFARELFELFSLGVGHYSERDVQEAARAFTGWHVRDGRFWKNERAHDAGAKQLFGAPVEDGGEVVDAAVRHPACAPFLAGKLLSAFVCDAPSAAAIAEVAAALREEELSIERTLRRLFGSRLFFAAEQRRARIAGPIEWCVGLLRRTRARCNLKAVAQAAAAMGQSLFAPPNVKGWEGGRTWISSRTLLARNRFAAALCHGEGELAIAVDWAKQVGALAEGAGLPLVAKLEALLTDDALEPATRARIVAFADDGAAAGSGVVRVQRVAHQLLGAPEAQLA